MKRILGIGLFCLCAAISWAGNYGILVNGTTYFAGELTGEFEGFTQYLAHVQVANGDQLKLYDAENQADDIGNRAAVLNGVAVAFHNEPPVFNDRIIIVCQLMFRKDKMSSEDLRGSEARAVRRLSSRVR